MGKLNSSYGSTAISLVHPRRVNGPRIEFHHSLQRGDANAQIAVVDEGLRPCCSHLFSFVYSGSKEALKQQYTRLNKVDDCKASDKTLPSTAPASLAATSGVCAHAFPSAPSAVAPTRRASGASIRPSMSTARRTNGAAATACSVHPTRIAPAAARATSTLGWLSELATSTILHDAVFPNR
jgi:hypothetical protein